LGDFLFLGAETASGDVTVIMTRDDLCEGGEGVPSKDFPSPNKEVVCS